MEERLKMEEVEDRDELERIAKLTRESILPNSIYFAHPINVYGTPKETELLEVIAKKFPAFNVYNPNQLVNEDNYILWRETTGKGINYFFEVVLPEMKSGIFLPFSDGMIGAGVFGEVEYLQKRNREIWEIDMEGVISKIEKLDEKRKLSIDETRKRVYKTMIQSM